MILLGDLVPDSKIDIDMLADSFAVSRSTVANALQALALEYLVKIIPHRGTYVRAFSMDELRETYEVRLCLELFAAKKSTDLVGNEHIDKMRRILDDFVPLFGSTQRADAAAFALRNAAFHTYLIGLANNKKLLDSYKRLNVEFFGYRIYRIRKAGQSTGEAIEVDLPPATTDHEEHQAIVNAYAARNLLQIEGKITTHIRHALENVV